MFRSADKGKCTRPLVAADPNFDLGEHRDKKPTAIVYENNGKKILLHTATFSLNKNF